MRFAEQNVIAFLTDGSLLSARERSYARVWQVIVMEWRVAVVDDLQSDRDALTSALREQIAGADELRLKCYSDAAGLLAEYSPGAYQLAFLDVCMDGMNGVALAERLREIDEKLLIVFLTTSPEYIFDVRHFHPFDYLIKPCAPEALDRVLREARRVLDATEPELTVPRGRSEYRVPYSAIAAVFSQGHAIEIRTVSGQVLRVVTTFSEVEQRLSADPRFLLCNRGVLVNMEHIAKLTDSAFRMDNGMEVPIRARKRRELTDRFSQYQISFLRRRME